MNIIWSGRFYWWNFNIISQNQIILWGWKCIFNFHKIHYHSTTNSVNNVSMSTFWFHIVLLHLFLFLEFLGVWNPFILLFWTENFNCSSQSFACTDAGTSMFTVAPLLRGGHAFVLFSGKKIIKPSIKNLFPAGLI